MLNLCKHLEFHCCSPFEVQLDQKHKEKPFLAYFHDFSRFSLRQKSGIQQKDWLRVSKVSHQSGLSTCKDPQVQWCSSLIVVSTQNCHFSQKIRKIMAPTRQNIKFHSFCSKLRVGTKRLQLFKVKNTLFYFR